MKKWLSSTVLFSRRHPFVAMAVITLLSMSALICLSMGDGEGNERSRDASGSEAERRSHSPGSMHGVEAGSAKLSVRDPRGWEGRVDQSVRSLTNLLEAEGFERFRTGKVRLAEEYRDPVVLAKFLNQIPDERVRHDLSSEVVAICSSEPENLLTLSSNLDDPYLRLRAKQRWAIEQVRREADPSLILEMIASLDDARERRMVASQFESDVSPRCVSDDYYEKCLDAILRFPELHDVIDVDEVQENSMYLGRRGNVTRKETDQ